MISPSDRAGTLAMSSMYAFQQEPPKAETSLQKAPNYLNEHLYFILNPIDSADWSFTLFAPHDRHDYFFFKKWTGARVEKSDLHHTCSFHGIYKIPNWPSK